MKKNVGRTDRIIRVIAGIALVAIGILVPMSTALGVALLIIGALLIVTGAIGFCPIYALLKMNTLGK